MINIMNRVGFGIKHKYVTCSDAIRKFKFELTSNDTGLL